MYIETLNDLFYALFRPVDGNDPVIKGHPRLAREDYFQMFFPEPLVSQYMDKTKSNLTWFFNDDNKNKAIKRTLIRLMSAGIQPIVSATHQKCRTILWPQGQHAAFDRKQLWEVFRCIRIRSALNARLRITEQAGSRNDVVSKLRSFFDADPSAAMARLILTLAVASDAPEDLVAKIWDSEAQDTGFLTQENSPEGRMRYGRLLYLSGKHEDAYRIFEEVARRLSRPAETREESEMYCRMGIMLSTGDGHYRDENAARKYLALGCLEENPESFYLLSKLTRGKEARTALERAAELHHIPAVRELGNAWYSGNARLGCDADAEKARHWFSQGLAEDSEDGAYCAYMLGRVYESSKDIPAAVSAYKIAREHGSNEAWERLSQLDWADPQVTVSQAQEAPSLTGPLRYCLMNAPTGSNRIFAETLPGQWDVTVCGSGTSLPVTGGNIAIHPWDTQDICPALRSLSGTLFSPEQESFPELVISLLSGDPQDNLYQAITALRVLAQLAGTLGQRKWELVDAVSLYVGAGHEDASYMLDAAFAGLRSVYFRVRLCDRNWDSADELFASAPLFLPCLQNPDARSVHMVVLGTSPAAMAILRRAVSMPLPESHPVNISVFGQDTAVMARRFAELCPGIIDAAPVIRRSIPTFCECALENGEVTALIRELKQKRTAQNEKPGSKAAELLGQGNYFVIATEDDSLNIRLGIQLRSELLKMDPTFTNLPFIAVLVRNPTASWLAGNISADARGNSLSWHSRYDLHCFGSAEQYSYQNLTQDLTEKRAIQVHLQYAADQERHLALASYYRRQYNRDSSRAVALYASSRLFAAGIALPDWKMYGLPDEEAKLSRDYEKWLGSEDHLDAAARMEHERWNCFLLSTGWEQATPSQVATYVQRGNPTHQLYLGKLHPFLCCWEDLESGEIQRAVADAVHSRFPEKTIHDPRTADKETALSAAAILSVR